MLDAKAIFDAADSKVEKVHVPEWGGDVYVRAITAEEVDAFEASVLKGGTSPRGLLAAMAICDEKGTRLFTDDSARQLGEKSGKALSRVVEKARRLAGMTAQDLEDARKN